jgi:hypothetical protein
VQLIRDAAVFELAKKQDGVISYTQLAELGVTRGHLGLRLRTGEWIRQLPGVVRMYWAEETWMQKVRATYLWAGPAAVVSHFSAAVLTGLGLPMRGVVHVTILHPFRLKAPNSWVKPHQALLLRRKDVESCAGIRVTSAARTLIDLAALVEPEELQQVADLALRSDAVTVDELFRFVGRGRGKRGLGAFLKWVVVRKSSADRFNHPR